MAGSSNLYTLPFIGHAQTPQWDSTLMEQFICQVPSTKEFLIVYVHSSKKDQVVADMDKKTISFDMDFLTKTQMVPMMGNLKVLRWGNPNKKPQQ